VHRGEKGDGRSRAPCQALGSPPKRPTR
jgi:hypothetical protein